MAKESGFIGEKGFGIPRSVFSNEHFNNSIMGASGKILFVEINPTLIRISSEKPYTLPYKNGAIFKADARTGILRFDIQTRDLASRQKYHPDFFADDLIDIAFRFFQTMKTELKAVAGKWYGLDTDNINDKILSVNYIQFIRALNGNPNPTLAEQIAAAKTTWTSRQVARNGYIHIPDASFEWDQTSSIKRVKLLYYKTPPKLMGE